MFASKITKVVVLPSAPDVSVTIRKLSALQLKAAVTADRIKDSKRMAAQFGDQLPAVMEAQIRLNHESEKAKAEAVARGEAQLTAAVSDPLDTHDLLTVLVSGVRAWTAPEAVNADTLSDLEDAEWLAREILALSLPSARSEADEKNAGSASAVV